MSWPLTTETGTMVILPQWQALLLVGSFMLLIAELGYRLTRNRTPAKREAIKEQIGAIQAAVLGLLGLLLGFTFSIAIDRYDQRRDLVVKEATAIRTVYLRASLLRDLHQKPVEQALRRYIDVRIEMRSKAADEQRLGTGARECKKIQAELWKLGAAAAREAPGPIVTSFIESLNDMIDTDTQRTAIGRAHVPQGVWLLLLFVAGCGALTTGYRAGTDSIRTALASWFLPLVITMVIVVIYDIANPLQGMISVDQKPMLDLQQTAHALDRPAE